MPPRSPGGFWRTTRAPHSPGCVVNNKGPKVTLSIARAALMINTNLGVNALLTAHAIYGVPIRHIYCYVYTYGKQIAMKGHNLCAWIKVGETAICGKSCCGTYCKIHLSKIRKFHKIPVRCRSCGKGVKSDIQLCRACGREKIRYRQKALEKSVRAQFNLVLEQLLAVRIPI